MAGGKKRSKRKIKMIKMEKKKMLWKWMKILTETLETWLRRSRTVVKIKVV